MIVGCSFTSLDFIELSTQNEPMMATATKIIKKL